MGIHLPTGKVEVINLKKTKIKYKIFKCFVCWVIVKLITSNWYSCALSLYCVWKVSVNITFLCTETVHALMACNAGTELSCISNIEDHVKMQNMPVLPFILHRLVRFSSHIWRFCPSKWKAAICFWVIVLDFMGAFSALTTCVTVQLEPPPEMDHNI